MQTVAKSFADDSDEELVTYYLDWTQDAIQELATLVEQVAATPSPQTTQQIYEITHNIKGMGTSFGFPLMTEAGRSLCYYLRQRGDAPLDNSVLEAHIKSFRLILAKRMIADGGEMGRSLVDRLNQLVEHMLTA